MGGRRAKEMDDRTGLAELDRLVEDRHQRFSVNVGIFYEPQDQGFN